MARDRYMTEIEAACFLGLSLDALRSLRKRNLVPYVRISARTIRYSENGLNAFIEKNTMKYTLQR